MLSFLQTMMLRYRDTHDSDLHEQARVRVPTFRQVVDWIAMLVDASFTQLILTEDTHELLDALKVPTLRRRRRPSLT